MAWDDLSYHHCSVASQRLALPDTLPRLLCPPTPPPPPRAAEHFLIARKWLSQDRITAAWAPDKGKSKKGNWQEEGRERGRTERKEAEGKDSSHPETLGKRQHSLKFFSNGTGKMS